MHIILVAISEKIRVNQFPLNFYHFVLTPNLTILF